MKPSEKLIWIRKTEVELKAKAASVYCQRVNEYTTVNGGKPWKYVLIPHNEVMVNMSVNNLMKQFEYKQRESIPQKFNLFFSDVIAEEEKYIDYLPLYPVEAIATNFGQEIFGDEIIGWWKNATGKKISKDMYIVRVRGRSMEPAIQDGDYCLFHKDRGGSREGKIVLVAFRNVPDPETMARYTIKRYHSEKTAQEGAPLQKRIVLSPDNPE